MHPPGSCCITVLGLSAHRFIIDGAQSSFRAIPQAVARGVAAGAREQSSHHHYIIACRGQLLLSMWFALRIVMVMLLAGGPRGCRHILRQGWRSGLWAGAWNRNQNRNQNQTHEWSESDRLLLGLRRLGTGHQ